MYPKEILNSKSEQECVLRVCLAYSLQMNNGGGGGVQAALTVKFGILANRHPLVNCALAWRQLLR